MTSSLSTQLNDFIVCRGLLIRVNQAFSAANWSCAQCCHAVIVAKSKIKWTWSLYCFGEICQWVVTSQNAIDNGLTRRTPWWRTDDKRALKESVVSCNYHHIYLESLSKFWCSNCLQPKFILSFSRKHPARCVSVSKSESSVWQLSTDLNSWGNYRWRNGNYYTTWKIGHRLETASVRLFEVKDHSSQLCVWCENTSILLLVPLSESYLFIYYNFFNSSVA